MSRSSRTNWTQEAAQRGIGKDFADSMIGKGRGWSIHQPVQCCECKSLYEPLYCTKLPASNLHICKGCNEQPLS